MMLENCGEHFDAVMDPILSRATSRKGRKLVFKLYLQTKLPNPHYIPEVQAQATLINFTVTEKGLEDQLLAVVVGKERPDLEAQRAELVAQQIEFTIRLKKLEDDLLERLANAEGDILGNEDLIIGLEDTKATSLSINAQ